MRQKAGLNVSKVATALNVSDKAIYAWESGLYFPESARLSDIAKLYGCTVDDLLRKENPDEA
jgi:DNA-binding XRE family transcriptional regulator